MKIEIDPILINFSLCFFAILKNKIAKCINKKSLKIKVLPILIKILLIYFAILVKFHKFFTKIKHVAVLVFSFPLPRKILGTQKSHKIGQVQLHVHVYVIALVACIIKILCPMFIIGTAKGFQFYTTDHYNKSSQFLFK